MADSILSPRAGRMPEFVPAPETLGTSFGTIEFTGGA